MRSLLRSAAGAFYIVAIATVLGLATNSIRSDSLPLLRKPLRETRAVAKKTQLISNRPVTLPSVAPLEADLDSAAPPVKNEPPKETLTVTKPPAQDSGQTNERTNQTASVADVSKTDQSEKVNPMPQKPVPATPVKKVEALFTTLEDAKTCFDGRNAVFVDARPAEDYDAEHISGAMSLFVEDLDKLYIRALGKVPKDQLIVTYCSDPECASAVKLADALVARGHTRVVILLEGLPGWKDAGYPTALEGKLKDDAG